MTTSQADIDALFAQTDGSASSRKVAPHEAADHAPTPSARVTPEAARGSPGRDLRRILGLSLPVTVTLAERDMAVEMILAIRVGTILEFDVLFDAELTLCVSNRSIGQGHAVKVGENFGLRVTTIETVEDRIEALGRESS